jgi:prevent-host-death family protein
METVDLAEAKARLSELVRRAERGETVQILRRGHLVALLTPAQAPRKPIDIAWLRSITDGMPVQQEGAGSFVRTMRDSDRY